MTVQGGGTVQGPPNMSGPGPAQAAQRNYLQALPTEVAESSGPGQAAYGPGVGPPVMSAGTCVPAWSGSGRRARTWQVVE